MKLFKIKNTLFAVHLESPLQKLGKSWHFNVNFNFTKTNITVNKGRAVVITYILKILLVSFLIQTIKPRMRLVQNI